MRPGPGCCAYVRNAIAGRWSEVPAPRPPLQSEPAVIRLLDRVPDPEALRAATAQAARRAEDTSASVASVFIFRLAAEWLGLPTAIVDEVVEPRPIHTVPHRREGVVRGLVNVRGLLTVCVALEPLFQWDTAHAGDARATGRRLLVLASQGQRLAFEADEVHGSHRYDPAGVGQVPATLAHSTSRFSTGVLAWNERSVGLLDAGLLLAAINRRMG